MLTQTTLFSEIRGQISKFSEEVSLKVHSEYHPSLFQVCTRLTQMTDSLENPLISTVNNLLFPENTPPLAYIESLLGLEQIQVLQSLPIYKHKVALLNAAYYKKLVIFQGETGCGKSTQIPQYFYTDPRFFGKSVYVTEPRKLAASSLARKVSKDTEGLIKVQTCLKRYSFNDLSKGDLVYFNEMTFLNVLLEEIGKEVPLQDCGVVVLDEIHEYSVEIEVILGLLLKFVQPKRKDLSIVLTSATLQRQELSALFNSPVIECQTRAHAVEVNYLKSYDSFYYEVLNTIERLVVSPEPKTILVFLTAFHQLKSAQYHLKNLFPTLDVFLLYGKQDPEEHEKIIRSHSFSRVILATNFAESSLTIPYVTHVVDCGREKVTNSNYSNFSNTKTEFISKASAIQRKGRTGRELPGICYRIYTAEEYEKMSSFKVPSIMMRNLENVILKFFVKNISVLDLPLIHKPSKEMINEHMSNIFMHRALVKGPKGLGYTKLGELMACIDIDPQLTKMIYISKGCLEVITIASVLHCCDFPFVTKDWVNSNTYFKRPEIVNQGDFLLILFLTRQYFMLRCKNCANVINNYWPIFECAKCSHIRKKWAKLLCVHEKSLRVAFELLREILEILERKKFTVFSMFNAEQEELEYTLALMRHESIFHSDSVYYIERVVGGYLGITEKIREILIKSLFRNVSEFIGKKGTDSGYLRIENKEIAVIDPSSALCSSETVSDYVICYKYSKTHKLFMKFLCPISYEELVKHQKDWLENIGYHKSCEFYDTVSLPNLGPAYFSEFSSQNYSYSDEISKDLSKNAVNALVNFDKKHKSLDITVKKKQSETAVSIVTNYLQKMKNVIYAKNTDYVSMNSSYCIVIGPGCIVERILNLHDEVKYLIKDLRGGLSNAEIIKDLRNTFDFNFVSVSRKKEKNCEATVYFDSNEQAEIAKEKLRSEPLRGTNGPIYEMSHILNNCTKGTKVKLIIPKRISEQEMQKTFGCSLNLVSISSVIVKESTEAILKFKNYESTEYFAHNFRVLIRERFGISFSSAKILCDGILIPKSMQKFRRSIQVYIQNLNKECNCEISLNEKASRIYCDFSKLPDSVKDRIILLIKSEFLQIPLMLYKEFSKMLHFYHDQKMNWSDWQYFSNVVCNYHQSRDILVIFGMPDSRKNTINYIRGLIHENSFKMVITSININKKKNLSQLKQIILSNDEVSFVVDEQENKIILKGIEKNLKNIIEKIGYSGQENFTKSEECSICCAPLLSDFFELSLCGHTVHKPCFVKSIENSLNDFNSLIPITCIYCSEFVTYSNLTEICGFELMKKIEFAAVKSFMYTKGKNDYSWCENNECSHIYQIFSVPSQKSIRCCPECRLKFCCKCKKQAFGNHEVNCEMNWIRENAQETEEWIVNNTTKCPNCAFSFEKAGGCNHLTCPCCKSHFCFLCENVIRDKIPVDHYRIKDSFCYNRYMNVL